VVNKELQQTKRGKAIATEVDETLFQAHRGAFVRGEELIVFGNDGFENDSKGRAKREVEAAITWAKDCDLEVTDFGTDEDGYSWALVCRSTDATDNDLPVLAHKAEDVLWKAWHGGEPDALARVFENVQRGCTMTAYEEAGV
jgi:hypothetical protein